MAGRDGAGRGGPERSNQPGRQGEPSVATKVRYTVWKF
jgi:hypothetical protein